LPSAKPTGGVILLQSEGISFQAGYARKSMANKGTGLKSVVLMRVSAPVQTSRPYQPTVIASPVGESGFPRERGTRLGFTGEDHTLGLLDYVGQKYGIPIVFLIITGFNTPPMTI
jgi:hypothetical protein